MSLAYDEKSIQYLEGIDAIRKRPNMYISSIGLEGVRQLFREILANSVDEHLAGHGNLIQIQKKGTQIVIRDFGRGIPFGLHDHGISTLTLVATKVHAGGKFDDNSYKVSGGLHGVGLSAVNALSTRMIIQSFRDGHSATQFFEKGVPTTEVNISRSEEPNGTLIVYEPDPEIFEDVNLPLEWIVEDLYYTACLNLLTIHTELDGHEMVLKDLTPSTLIENDEKYHEVIQVPWIKSGQVQICFAFTLSPKSRSVCFVNSIPVGSGNFLTSFYERFSAKLITSNLDFTPTEVEKALSIVISVRAPVDIIHFRGQTKDTAKVIFNFKDLYDYILDQIWRLRGFKSLLTTNYKPYLSILQKQRRRQEDINKALKELKDDTPTQIILPGKLSDCQDKWTGELYLVEGESAGGSAKQSRDRKTQAVLPLKGKILNALKKGVHKTVKNDIIKDLFQCIGVEIDKKQVRITPRYEKIIIATDADSDGSHIRCLLLVLFLSWLRPLIENGYIYVARPPLYKIQDKKGRSVFIKTKEELNRIIIPDTATVTRFKGLGELNADDLREAIFDPNTREIVRVTLDDLTSAATVAYTLLGPDADTRFDFLKFYSEECVFQKEWNDVI